MYRIRPRDRFADRSDESDQSGPDKVVVVEKWKDLAALKAHSVAPHMQAYRVNVKEYVRGMQLLVLDPAE